MIDLLTDLGQSLAPQLLAPLACWTVLALVAEGAFRMLPVPAGARLPVRQTLLFALGPALLLPFLTDALAPTVDIAVVQSAMAVFELPAVTVGEAVALAEPEWTVWTAAGGMVALALGLGGLALARLGMAWVRLHRHRARLAPADGAALADGDAVAGELGLRHRPDLARGAAAASPYTVGLRRPVVVLPDDLDGPDRHLALAHEFVHVRRRDYGWTLAERAAVALCAAHPLVHVLAAGAALDRECLVDADVVQARPTERRAYADLLLHFAARPAPPLAIGAASSPLKHRLHAMNRSLSLRALRRARIAGRALAASLAAVLLLAGFSTTTGTDNSFRVVNPTVTLDGVESTFAGSVRMETFGVFGLDVPGFGRFLMSADPFPGATHLGMVNDDHITASPSGHSLVVASSAPIMDGDELVAVYTRFVAHRAPKTLESGFEMRIGASATADGMTRTFDSGTPGNMMNALENPQRALERAASRLRVKRVTRRDTTDVFEVVDEQPELIGGLAALQSAIVYPRLQLEAGIEGRTFVQFVVTPTGGVRDVIVARSSGDAGLDAAAVSAVESVRFTPGIHNGRAVAVRFALPIAFRLGDGPPRPPNAPPPPPGAPAPPPNAPAPPPPPPPPPGVDLPELIGGLSALQSSVVYPEAQARAGIEGIAYVRFVVSKTGAVRDMEIARSAGDPALDEAAQRAVAAARFRPGRKDGEPAAIRYVVPIHFRLAGD